MASFFQKQFGYEPFGQVRQNLMSQNPAVRAQAEVDAGAYSREMQREQHERALQQQEQARRQYDSTTQREKLGILKGLLR